MSPRTRSILTLPPLHQSITFRSGEGIRPIEQSLQPGSVHMDGNGAGGRQVVFDWATGLAPAPSAPPMP
jgi:hypothetical protein